MVDIGTDFLDEVAAAAIRDRPTVTRDGRARTTAIEGVLLERCRMHSDNRGVLIPAMDARNPFWAEPVVYSYFVTVLPGRIKGWGMHERQTDRYFVRGDVRVVLFDGRRDSPTAGAVHTVWFSRATPGLVLIPPGVWHADQAWGEQEAIIVNFPTRPYDPDEPDKYRIDPNSGVIPFDWRLPDG